MATFKDLVGREWSLEINTFQLGRVRKATGFELAKLLDEDLRRLNEVANNPELLCRIVFALCADQAAERGVAEEDFYRSIVGDVLEAIFDAFTLAYADFCPSRRRALFLSMMEKDREVGEAIAKEVNAAIEAVAVDDVKASLTEG